MRSAVPRALALLLAASALSCDKNPVSPPDSAECETIQVTFTVASNPSNFNETGTLAATSCLLGPGTYADRYKLVLEVPTNVDINLTSTDLDPYLILRNADDTQIEFDDDGGTEQNARMNFTLVPGTYYIMATTYVDGAMGNYALNVAGTTAF